MTTIQQVIDTQRLYSETLAKAVVRDLLQERFEIIFDVGAHDGTGALEFCANFSPAQIHCFEPDPSTFKTLLSKCNQLPLKAIANNVGVGDHNCIQDFAVLNQTGSSSYLDLNPSSPYKSGIGLELMNRIKAPIVTLDSYCENMEIDTIDFLKIDTQGFEINVLRGAKSLLERSAIKIIQFELLFRPLYVGHTAPSTLLGYLESMSYRLLTLHSFWPSPGARLFQCDAIYCHKSILGE